METLFTEVFDLSALAIVLVASWVISQFIEKLKEPVKQWYDALPDWGRALTAYLTIILGASLAWFTGLNMFPVFSNVWVPLGRILTCLAAGFGPSWIYDMYMDKPTAPAS